MEEQKTARFGKYQKADPHAPRFMKDRFDILNADNKPFFDAMKRQYPELVKYKNSEIARYIELFNKRISEEIIDNRNGIKLPDGLGIIVAGACRVSTETARKNTNYELSAQLEKRVPHQNLHSDEYIAKVKYTNEIERHMFENHHMWCFEGCRPLTRTVAAEWKKEGGHLKYIVFTTRQHIAHLFRKQKIKSTAKQDERKKQQLDQYDEFAF